MSIAEQKQELNLSERYSCIYPIFEDLVKLKNELKNKASSHQRVNERVRSTRDDDRSVSAEEGDDDRHKRRKQEKEDVYDLPSVVEVKVKDLHGKSHYRKINGLSSTSIEDILRWYGSSSRRGGATSSVIETHSGDRLSVDLSIRRVVATYLRDLRRRQRKDEEFLLLELRIVDKK